MLKMKKIGAVLLAAVLAVLAVGCQSPSQDTQTSSSETMAHQIVALSVSLVEILGELGIEMVGVPTSQYALHEKAKSATEVGPAMSPDTEILAMLNPTHVLGLTTLESTIQPKLDQVGIKGTYMNMENIDAMKETITELGSLFGKESEAATLIEGFEAEVNEALSRVEGKEAPKVLILFGFPGNYLVATKASFVGQMVELLGGENVIGEDSMAYANVNMEELMVQAPDVILRLAHGIKADVLEMFDKEFSENPVWQQFEAVKTGKVYDLDDSKFNVSATLQTAEALGELAEMIYP